MPAALQILCAGAAMPKTNLKGVQVSYAETGSGDTLVLLHASASSSAQWRSLTEALRATCHIVAPDLYGYGDTGPWSGCGSFTLGDEVDLINAVLPAGGKPIHLVGHSYGGAVALRFAAQNPGRLRRLVLIEPVSFHLLRDKSPDPESHHLFSEVNAVATFVSKVVANGDYHGAMARFVDYWNGEGTWLRTKPEVQASLARRAPKVVLDFWATMTEMTSRTAYRRIIAPTLVLRGSQSPWPARHIAELVADALPQSQLQTIDGAGHMLAVTHSEAVDTAIVHHLFHN